MSGIHFIEENSDRGFCCEECIMEFYRPYMQAFEQEEEDLRQELHLFEEDIDFNLLVNETYLQKALTSPDEVWHYKDEISQSFYTHIFEHKTNDAVIYQILIASYIDNSPAFVYYRTLTKELQILERYKRGVQLKVDDLIPDESMETQNEIAEIANEIIEEVESKKSMLLAQMLEHRTNSDIDFEEFIVYDKYLEQTINTPDEMFIIEDETGDEIYSCIRFFKMSDKTMFFYIALAYPYQDKLDNEVTHLIPILGFPSNDKKLYEFYANGESVTKRLKS